MHARALQRRWTRLVILTHTEAHHQHVLAAALLLRVLRQHYERRWPGYMHRHERMMIRALAALERRHDATLAGPDE